MSARRSLSWSAALRDIRDDRIEIAQPKLAWAHDGAFGACGGWQGRDADGELIGTVYLDGRLFRGILCYPDSTACEVLPASWEGSPVGLRQAKVAVEAALSAYLAKVAA